jgi:hypothetical protein
MPHPDSQGHAAHASAQPLNCGVNQSWCDVQRYIFQPEYARLNAEERATLLETGICPPGGLPGCDDMVMNFAVDWNLLHGALHIAFGDMHQKHSHILDGTG